jgi:2'-5' RNA ligase
MKTIRTFIAVDLPETVRQLLETFERELGRDTPSGVVRWVPPGNIHLTLRFLGDTPVERMTEVSSALDHVAARHTPFRLHLDKLGCFPNPRRPRVVWVGVTDNKERLRVLQEDVEAAMRVLGWKPEGRPFHPHLTLGRVKDSRSLVEARLPWGQLLEPRQIPVETIHLIESRLEPSGAVYSLRNSSHLQQDKD